MRHEKSFSKRADGKIIVATLFGCALIMAHPITALKLRDKPPSWKVTSERYGVGWQFGFGKSTTRLGAMCDGTVADVTVNQRNSFGPIYYERSCTGKYRISSSKQWDEPNADSDSLFAELQ